MAHHCLRTLTLVGAIALGLAAQHTTMPKATAPMIGKAPQAAMSLVVKTSVPPLAAQNAEIDI